MDNSHTEHNQQSTEDTKHDEKKPQTSLYNCKITGIPQLEYTSAIWDPHTAKDMYNINKIQNYAARWVHHDYSHYTSVSFLQKNN